jgi:hypothetical protein
MVLISKMTTTAALVEVLMTMEMSMTMICCIKGPCLALIIEEEFGVDEDVNGDAVEAAILVILAIHLITKIAMIRTALNFFIQSQEKDLS